MNYLANKFSACASRLARKDDGAVAIMIAFLFVLIAMGAGIAIDYGRTVHAQTKMQAALDSAVLAGARAAEGEQISVAEKMFTTNFDQNAASGVSTAFKSYGDGVFGGTATGVVKTTLAGILGVKQLDVGVASKAKGVGMDEVALCILVLDKNATPGLRVNSGANINAPDCEIHVETASSQSAIFNTGSTIVAERVCIEGTKILVNGGNQPKNLELGCTVDDDPYAGKFATPSIGACKYQQPISGQVALDPGVYCGDVNFNGNPNVTLKPGVYILKNSRWNVSGQLNGTGVTFYLDDAHSTVQINGSGSGRITAPASGMYKNVVMFEKAGLSRSNYTFDQSDKMHFDGILHLPSRDMIVNSASSSARKKMTLIVKTLILNQIRWDLSPATDGGGITSIKTVHLIE